MKYSGLLSNHFDEPLLDDGPLAGDGVWHFGFHVWVWRANPLGITAREHPLASCENEIDLPLRSADHALLASRMPSGSRVGR